MHWRTYSTKVPCSVWKYCYLVVALPIPEFLISPIPTPYHPSDLIVVVYVFYKYKCYYVCYTRLLKSEEALGVAVKHTLFVIKNDHAMCPE